MKSHLTSKSRGLLEAISLASVPFLCSAVTTQHFSPLDCGIPLAHKQDARTPTLELTSFQPLQVLHNSLLASAMNTLKRVVYISFSGSFAICPEQFQEAFVPIIPVRQPSTRLPMTSIMNDPIILVSVIGRGTNSLYA